MTTLTTNSSSQKHTVTREFVVALADLSRQFQSLFARLSPISEVALTLQKMSRELQSAAGKLTTLNTVVQEVEEASRALQQLSAQVQVEEESWSQVKSRKRMGCLYAATSNYPSLTRNYFYEQVLDLIRLAGHDNGRPFGGVVRDLLVPVKVLGSSLDSVDFKDVDLWFTNQDEADRFVSDMSHSLTHQKGPYSDSSLVYPFSRQRYMYVVDQKKICLVDVVVCPTLPVNDFSVNLLTYHDEETREPHLNDLTDSKLSGFESHPVKGAIWRTAEDIVWQIEEKEADVLPGYLVNLYEENQFTKLTKQRIGRMIGWGYLFSNLSTQQFNIL